MPAWVKLNMLREPRVVKPALVQGLPGLGFVGKLAVSYLIDELELKPFAEIYSSYLVLPDGNTGVQIREDGTYYLPRIELYEVTQSKKHAILITGEVQPTIHGQYELISQILDLAQRYGCDMVIALGGFQTPLEREIGKVYGVFNNHSLEKTLKNLGVEITRSGAITGACGVILGLGNQRNLPSIGLLGATRGEYPDMEAAKSVLKVLTKILGLELSFSRLDREIQELKSRLEVIRRLQAETLQRPPPERRPPDKAPFYI
ncbi:MAG: hypothetical protein DRO46_01345 [Candidatus Hecatellales archaeon]|nr:MAG: hypothetical protein DRO46_01345 [Candidatus Hecatellales archaeon]